MGIIEDELAEVRKLAEHVIPGCKLVSCVRAVVRAEIKRTRFKTLIVCIQFPGDYPKKPILIELKSKTLSEKLIQGLTNVAEAEAKKHLGKPQILNVLQFLRNFIDENPLSCCYDEIQALKHILKDDDELKLRQKTSSISLKVACRKYFLKCNISISDNYPNIAVGFHNIDSNLTPALIRHVLGQAKEIARTCVEQPLKKPKLNDPPFKPKPSLEKSLTFLINSVKCFPTENCQFCKESCLPEEPELAETNEESPKHIERIYCGHLFHLGCLQKYMKLPPFGDKNCTACGLKIYHYKWNLSDKLAEDRWAHEQARERELAEVEDFLK